MTYEVRVKKNNLFYNKKQIVYIFMKNINILKIIKKKIKPETECIIIFKNLII